MRRGRRHAAAAAAILPLLLAGACGPRTEAITPDAREEGAEAVAATAAVGSGSASAAGSGASGAAGSGEAISGGEGSGEIGSVEAGSGEEGEGRHGGLPLREESAVGAGAAGDAASVVEGGLDEGWPELDLAALDTLRGTVDLAGLLDPDPQVRRATLLALPRVDYERVPESAIPELARLAAEGLEGQPIAGALAELVQADRHTAALALAVDLARAREAVRGREGVRGQPGMAVVTGKLELADAAGDPREVTAQMAIHEGGFFAGPVADIRAPLSFQAEGYGGQLRLPAESLAASGAPPPEVIDLGTVRLERLGLGEAAALRGRLAFDSDAAPESAELELRATVHPVNSPDGRVAPRDRWPEPLRLEAAEDGSFEAAGIAPGRYRVRARAAGLQDRVLFADLGPGQRLDLGTLRLANADLAFYESSAGPPEAPELRWSGDWRNTLALARTVGRPALVYSSAPWCLPCRQLEQTTLSDPWARLALAPFLLAEAVEDGDFNKRHRASGYPTIVLFDGTGAELARFSGYAPVLPFVQEILASYPALELPIPPALQALVDRGVIRP